ncbi:MAG: hypothetical protein PHS53_04085 [Candidatus Pacebacteria bacterium]|nr:hypothetical protein [Candidatus Paceibacterota bacterium]
MPILFFRKKGKEAQRKGGATLIETLVYIFILVILLTAVVTAMIAFSRSFRLLQSGRNVENSAIDGFERMTREIHDAKSIDISGSTLNSSPGVLLLNTTNASGATSTVQFFVTSQTLHVKENGTDQGALTRSSARVTSLTFQRVTTSLSEAVKISMTVESGTSTSYKQASFQDTAVLRGSYPLQ